MPKRSKYVKPEQRRLCPGTVLASKRISPNFVRVTIGGEGLAEFTPMGYDQWFRLFLPHRDGADLNLPSTLTSKPGSNLWYAQYLMTGKDNRPVIRNYTVRGFRRAGQGEFGDTAELDIDFALHGTDTPACAWATTAQPGSPVAVLDEGIMYQAPPGAWALLAGDESALPAIAGILRSAPRDTRGAAFLEITHPEDAQELGQPEGVQVTWLLRTDSEAAVGTATLDAVRATDIPSTGVYAFVAGEQKLATTLRRHLVTCDIPKADITFTGYWRVGHAQG
jgi:NADPH-dependent ferric siderophore reductase